MTREPSPSDRAAALALLQRTPVVRVATTLPSGEPVLRTAPALIADGAVILSFDLPECAGRPAVVAAEEVVGQLPIELLDRRALAAPLLSISAEVRGVLAPLEAGAPRPLLRVPLDNLRFETSLAEAFSAEERTDLLELLWRRGLPGDPRAIELVREHHPDTPLPGFLAAPELLGDRSRAAEGLSLHCQLDPPAAAEVSALLDELYWNVGVGRPAIERAHLGAQAWVGVRDGSGRVVASARALSDGARWAWIYDVVVAPQLRRSGLGQAVMKLVLDHPAVRQARNVRLQTRDAQSLYARFGFVPSRELPPKGYVSTEMALVRTGSGPAGFVPAVTRSILDSSPGAPG